MWRQMVTADAQSPPLAEGNFCQHWNTLRVISICSKRSIGELEAHLC